MEPEEALTTLCSSCGLCCDGALFTQVPLTDDDADVLRRNGLDVAIIRKAPILLQRCGALVGTCCRVYAERPLMCRAYSCKLYKAVHGGTVPLQEALVTVRAAQEMKRTLEPAAKVGESIASGERTDSGKFLAFDAFLERHFVDPPRRDDEAPKD